MILNPPEQTAEDWIFLQRKCSSPTKKNCHILTEKCTFLQNRAFFFLQKKKGTFLQKNAFFFFGGGGHMAGNLRKLQEGFRAQESRTLANFYKIFPLTRNGHPHRQVLQITVCPIQSVWGLLLICLLRELCIGQLLTGVTLTKESDKCMLLGMTVRWRSAPLEAKNPPQIPKYHKKHRVRTNFFEKFARTFAFFPVMRVRNTTKIVQKNLFRWTFLFWVDFFGFIFLLRPLRTATANAAHIFILHEDFLLNFY